LEYTREICQSNDFAGSPDYTLSFSRILIYFCPKKRLLVRLRPLKNVNFCSSSRKTENLTTGIYGIFRGLNFASDAEIGQKGAFFKGLRVEE
jgi:hypothetical protein